MADVVNLLGKPVTTPGQICDATVNACEQLLEEARSGKIIGIVAVTLLADRQSPERLRAGTYNCAAIVGSLEMAKLAVVEDCRFLISTTG